MRRFGFVFFIFLVNLSAQAEAATLLSAHRSVEGERVILTFHFSSKPEIFSTFAQQPSRLVVMVKGQGDPQTFSELLGGVVSSVSLLSGKEGWFRIEVAYSGNPQIKADVEKKTIRISLQPSKVSLNLNTGRLKGYRIRRVAVDPGHGGEDRGAKGPTGLVEKEVSLDISRRLVQQLSELNVEAFLTRTGDYYLNLRDRTLLANLRRADLFISIHANAIGGKPSVSGSAVYFCSEKASDKFSQMLAEQENAVDQESDRQQGNTLDFEALLFRFERKLYWEDSRQFCQGIIGPMTKFAGTGKFGSGVKSANFSVLRNAKMPAILVETAFITNPREEELLKTSSFRQKIAEGIVQGLRPWLEGGE